jgi:hypothetical protein
LSWSTAPENKKPRLGLITAILLSYQIRRSSKMMAMVKLLLLSSARGQTDWVMELN